MTDTVIRGARRAARAGLVALWRGLNAAGLPVPPGWIVAQRSDRAACAAFASGAKQTALLAICDFASFPLSYDVVTFLAVAEARRAEIGASRLDVAFVLSAGQSRALAYDIALDATRLFPSVGDVALYANRANLAETLAGLRRRRAIFPPRYDPLSPEFRPDPGLPPLYGMRHLDELGPAEMAVRPPETALEPVDRWLRPRTAGRTVVTITLRQSDYQPERNSDIAAWQALIDAHGDGAIAFVVVPDHARAGASPSLQGPSVVECREAALSLPFRAALYARADLNLLVNNGPAVLCYLNPDTRYIVFKLTTAAQSTRPEDLDWLHGLRPGDDLPFAGPYQKLVWQTDAAETLIAETKAMLSRLSDLTLRRAG